METDKPLKRLFQYGGTDIAAWLLGHDVVAVAHREVKLPASRDPIIPDALLYVTLADGREVLLHIEFQAYPSPRPMRWRMLEYMQRISEAPDVTVPVYYVIMYFLGVGADDTGVHTTVGFDNHGITWRYRVLHLWRMTAEELLAAGRPAVLALIGQTRISDPHATADAVIAQVNTITDRRTRATVLDELLALCTDKELTMIFESLIQSGKLPETEGMRMLKNLGREEGIAVGREEGREQGQLTITLRLLTRKFGPLDAAVVAHIEQLHGEQLLALADALLDFTRVDDLTAWLATHGPPAA